MLSEIDLSQQEVSFISIIDNNRNKKFHSTAKGAFMETKNENMLDQFSKDNVYKDI